MSDQPRRRRTLVLYKEHYPTAPLGVLLLDSADESSVRQSSVSWKYIWKFHAGHHFEYAGSARIKGVVQEGELSTRDL